MPAASVTYRCTREMTIDELLENRVSHDPGSILTWHPAARVSDADAVPREPELWADTNRCVDSSAGAAGRHVSHLRHDALRRAALSRRNVRQAHSLPRCLLTAGPGRASGYEWLPTPRSRSTVPHVAARRARAWRTSASRQSRSSSPRRSPTASLASHTGQQGRLRTSSQRQRASDASTSSFAEGSLLTALPADEVPPRSPRSRRIAPGVRWLRDPHAWRARAPG